MSKYIDSLTKEQEDLLQVYADKWIKFGLKTDDPEKFDKDSAINAVKRVYECSDMETPEHYIILRSPYEVIVGVTLVEACGFKPSEITSEFIQQNKHKIKEARDFDIYPYLSGFCYGSQDYWVCYYDYFKNVLEIPGLESVEGLVEAAQHCGWFLAFDEAAFISMRPTILEQDDDMNLHSLTGPAVAFADGFKFYAIHGMLVDDYIIEEPEKITVDDIESEENVEIRRVKIDQYDRETPGKYLMDSGAEEIHRDDWGILYKKEMENDEPIVMVKVVNSTPESDGTFKEYFIRVRPDVTTAHEAVASTFRTTTEEYNPQIQT